MLSKACLRCDTLSVRYLEDKKFRLSYMNLHHLSLLQSSDSFSDEIYRLHLARAISRPCYLIACYVTVKETKPETPLKWTGETVRGHHSFFSQEYIRNLSKLSTSMGSLAQENHAQADPMEKNFQAVPDCRTHHECNDPVFRSLSLSRTVKDRSSLSPEYKQVEAVARCEV